MIYGGTDRILQENLIALLNSLRALSNIPITKARVSTDGSLVIAPSSSISVTQSGTWNLGNFPYSQLLEIIQRSNIEYNECQRSKFTF